MTIYTTQNSSSINTINTTYFNDSLDLSLYGNNASIIEFNDIREGVINTSINIVNSNNIKLVFFDNLVLKEIKIREGINYFYSKITSNYWGFLLFPMDANIISTMELDIKSIYAPDPLTYATIGNVEIDIFNRKVILSTNAESISVLSTKLFDDRNYLKDSLIPFNSNKGSALIIDNLSTGNYSFNISLGKYDKSQNDSLFLYNGKSFISLCDVNGLINNQDVVTSKNVDIEVIYGFIYLMALDSNRSTGLTEFVLTDVNKISELNYIPLMPISLIPNKFSGRVIANKNQVTISTGSGSIKFADILSNLNLIDFIFPNSEDKRFIEGSYVFWDLENGKYNIKWKFKTTEPDNKDSVYIYDGEYNLLNTLNSENETLIELENNQLGILIFDEGNSQKTSEITITNIEKISQNEPDNRTNEGTNEQFNFRLGGDITSYSVSLNITETKQINFTTDNLVIWEFIKDNAVVYNQEYTNEIYAYLLAGKYELKISTESSIEVDSILNLSFGEAINPIPDSYLVIGESSSI